MQSQLDLIFKHFPDLSAKQQEQFIALNDLYLHWNSQINVMSRKDTENFYERHVLHSLGIAKIQAFLPESQILDVGTGGGFPGIPLAILFPESEFTLVDSIGKKIKVVSEVAAALDLKNVIPINDRVENVKGQFDFIVSRAVTQMPEFLRWVKKKVKSESKHELRNGILYLKGGDLIEEMSGIQRYYKFHDLYRIFPYDFFQTKKVVYLH
ncbi:MAG: 16S rRNA (guanine(527)-N(7))-methyltransferase RsmG [Bacteroidetes bacterium]|nr:16S rRNA (guanine(527)-N(7))-methyltransferase RsmG [Bacteroidota bacterium]